MKQRKIWRPELCNRNEYLMNTSAALQEPSFCHILREFNAKFPFGPTTFLKIHLNIIPYSKYSFHVSQNFLQALACIYLA